MKSASGVPKHPRTQAATHDIFFIDLQKIEEVQEFAEFLDLEKC